MNFLDVTSLMCAANMTLAEKIGQMIMIDYRKTTEMTVELEEILTKYNPGGFILFKEVNPLGIKYALSLKKAVDEYYLDPLFGLSYDLKLKIKEEYERLIENETNI